MVAFKSKRADRQENGSNKDAAPSWKKNDEELDLEERLFGTSRKRRKASPTAADEEDSEEEDGSDDGLRGMKDSDVSQLMLTASQETDSLPAIYRGRTSGGCIRGRGRDG